MHQQRTRIASLSEQHLGQSLYLGGWLRTVRAQKSFTFCELYDGSQLGTLQLILEETLSGYADLIPQLGTGVSVWVQGTLVPSPGKGQQWELKVERLEVLGTCPQEEYPLQKKRHSLEFLRTIAHLRPRTNLLGAVARIRNCLAYATHRFFQEEGFLYVQTPILTASDCEGGGEQFRVTTLDLEQLRSAPRLDDSLDFFGKPAYLTVSGQLNAEIYASALSDIYTFSPTFRAENSNTSRHLAEFWMVEPEMAFADLNDNIDLAERYLRALVQAVLQERADDLALFDQFVEPGLIGRLEHTIAKPFTRLTYTEAVQVLKQSGKSFAYPVEWGKDLQSEHERYLAEEHYHGPVVVTNYPRGIKAFYMRDNDDGTTVAAMDILVPKVGEIIGGSQREERYDRLEKKIQEHGLPKGDYWWYLELRKYGSVPHSGFGLGFERMVLFVTGLENIRDAIPFPRYPGHAEF